MSPPLLGPNAELREIFARLDFVTGSDALIPLLRQANKAASINDVTILLEGETGTGKQVLARAIHQIDEKRRGCPFVTVNCPTVTEALAESELFGYQRGAFTGAVSNRPGLFHAANHGTLFFDDVNDLPLHIQPKLLDVIQRGVVRPIGCDKETPVDIRIVTACNQPPRPLVIQNRFRADLYHRLNAIHRGTKTRSGHEQIAEHGTSQSAKAAALGDAVLSRRLDLVELLLANGGDIKAVPLADVLLTWEPKLIHFFLDHGADPVEGRPFAVAFGAKVRTALRPLVEYKQAHLELAGQLQEILDCALRHLCGEGGLKMGQSTDVGGRRSPLPSPVPREVIHKRSGMPHVRARGGVSFGKPRRAKEAKARRKSRYSFRTSSPCCHIESQGCRQTPQRPQLIPFVADRTEALLCDHMCPVAGSALAAPTFQIRLPTSQLDRRLHPVEIYETIWGWSALRYRRDYRRTGPAGRFRLSTA